MIVAKKGSYYITINPINLDLEVVHEYLSNSYWAKGRSMEVVKTSIKNSTCFCLFDEEQQIGFARVISDQVIMAYLMDVFVLPDYQGKGLGKFLMESILNFEDYKNVKKWILVTKDAEEFYKQFGFVEFDPANRNWMEKKN